MLSLSICLLAFFGASQTWAQTANSEDQVKSLSQSFSESDVFHNVDSEPEYDTKAFSAGDAEGTVKCWRWYYRPVRRYYYWRPVYYRPYYCYYRYYCRPYSTYFTWTTIAVYKGSGNQGAMLDTDPAAGSVLAAQGLRKGDIITSIDGKPLRNLSDMNQVTQNSRLGVQKGGNVKFAGNLLKNGDEQYMKNFDGLQEVEAGTLLTKDQVRQSNYNMYQLYAKSNAPALGVKAVDNNGSGVKVTEVVADLPGMKAGFEVGDVILEINGRSISNEREYSDAIDCSGNVARMKVTCGKTGQTFEINVILNK